MFYATDTDWREYVNLPQLPTGNVTRKQRKPRARKPGDLTVADLRALLTAAGVKFTTKHTKAELMQMHRTGETMRAAAQDRENARRRLARALKAG